MDTNGATQRDPLDAEVDFLTPELRSDLLDRWHEPQRVYHDVEHLVAVLRAVDLLEDAGESFDGTAVRLAAWFHGAVFDPAGTENTEKSALLAERALDPAAPVQEVARLIRMTSGHHVTDGDLDAAVFSDADMSVLGSEPESYDRYSRDVREEYAHVPDDRFRAGRGAALEALLERKAIFHTTAARDQWEKQARANLHRELGLLGRR